MKTLATLLNRLSIMFIALSIIGVGLIIISNLSVPFLPDTFDAARPQDTWSCCAAPRKTANALRWPLFLTGGLLLFISIVWGIYYLGRGLRQLVGQSPDESAQPVRRTYRILEIGLRLLALLMVMSLGATLICLFLTPHVTLLQDIAQHSSIFVHIMYATTGLLLATGCLALPLYTLIGTNRWQNKAIIDKSRWLARHTSTLVWYGLAMVCFLVGTCAWLYYIIGDDTNRKYPIDVLVRQAAWPFGVHFLSVTVISLIAFAVMITITVFRQPRDSRK